MKQFCQVLIAVMMIAGFFKSMYENFHGREAKQPWGFSGAVIDVLVSIVAVIVYWYAGAFSELF